MSCQSNIRDVFHEAGRRVTTSRLHVAAVLRHAGGHRTAEQIHALVHGDDPGSAISLSTVYRTLDTLARMRLVSEVDEGGGRAAYQWLDATKPHHHLLCNRCAAEGALSGELFERLETAIRDETGFEPFLDHFVIAGLCRDCAAYGDEHAGVAAE
jgi:Fur family ferric uptake transcriptional regulator